MPNRTLTAALVFCAAACVPDYRVQERCTPGESARAWVAACIRDGNPKSDEEPEDLIRQCESTARRLHCDDTALMVERRRYGADWVPCEGAKDPRAAEACREAGWEGDDG